MVGEFYLRSVKLIGKLLRVKSVLASLYFGNTVDPRANVLGIKNWKSAISRSGIPVNSLHNDLAKNGYVNLGKVFDDRDIQLVRKEYLNAMASSNLSESPFESDIIKKAYNYGGFEGDVSQYRRDVIDCNVALPSVNLLWCDSNFIEKLTQVLRCSFEPSSPSVSAWRISHIPKDISEKFEVTTNRFHFDDQYVDRIKIFIYLSDVTEKDGPFSCFPKYYSRKLLLQGFRKEKRSESLTGGMSDKVLESPELVHHIGPAGTVIVCATSFCCHRAGEPDFGHVRDLLQLAIRPSIIKFTGV